MKQSFVKTTFKGRPGRQVRRAAYAQMPPDHDAVISALYEYGKPAGRTANNVRDLYLMTHPSRRPQWIKDAQEIIEGVQKGEIQPG